MPATTGKPCPRRSSGGWLAGIVATLMCAVLSAVAVPTVHAQILNWPGGTVKVTDSPMTDTMGSDSIRLEINEGESTTYYVKLNQETRIPEADKDTEDWWVFVHINGVRPIKGKYIVREATDTTAEVSLTITPSIGREVYKNEWNTWQSVKINANGFSADQAFTFTHEVWDHDANCPVHNVGAVTVVVRTDAGEGGNNGNPQLPPRPTLSINNVEVAEDGGNAEFTVTLSDQSDDVVTAYYATSGGTARAGGDYTHTTGTLTFDAGIRTKTIEVPVLDDEVVEPDDETFFVTLTEPTNATISKGRGTGTIADNDGQNGQNGQNSQTVSFSSDSYRVTEGSSVTVTVVLSEFPASGETVTVSLKDPPDGNADPADYSEIPTSVTFGQSEMRKTFTVHTTEDEDDDDEQVILELENPSSTDPSSDWKLADPEVATITIHEHHHTDEKENWKRRAVSGWLREFGNAAAMHVLEALDERIRCAPMRRPVPGRPESSRSRRGCEPRNNEPMSLEIAGYRFPIGGTPSDASELSHPIDGSADAWAAGDWPLEAWDRHASRSLTAREVLAGSAFHISSGSSQDRAQEGRGRFSIWGRGGYSGFDDDEDGVSTDGDVTSVSLGMDFADRRLLAGIAFSHTQGDGAFSYNGVEGKTESTLTSIHPYLYVRLDERVSVWGAAGFGSGSLKLRMKDQESSTDISTRMGAVGVRRELLYPAENWGVSAALKADALFTRAASDASRDLAGARATTNRQRVAVEASQEFTLVSGAWVAPFTEVGARHDGGTGPTELGLEVRSGFRYEYPLVGWTAEFSTRGLLEDSITEFEEMGVSGTLRYDPILNSPLGPDFALSIAGGLEGWFDPEASWGRRTMGHRRTDDRDTPDMRIDAEFGYGLPVLGSSGTSTPWVGASMSERWRDLRLGYRLGFGSDTKLGVEGALRQSAVGDEASDYSIMLRFSMR